MCVGVSFFSGKRGSGVVVLLVWRAREMACERLWKGVTWGSSHFNGHGRCCQLLLFWRQGCTESSRATIEGRQTNRSTITDLSP